MSEEDNFPTAFGYLILTSVAGRNLFSAKRIEHSLIGVHGSLLFNGFIGCLYYQKSCFNSDVTTILAASNESLKYLMLPCVMADLHLPKHNWSVVHLFSGIMPFTVAMTGKGSPLLGHVVVLTNAISLFIYSAMNKHNEWGYATVAATCHVFFLTPFLPKAFYPLSLAFTGFCIYKLLGTERLIDVDLLDDDEKEVYTSRLVDSKSEVSKHTATKPAVAKPSEPKAKAIKVAKN